MQLHAALALVWLCRVAASTIAGHEDVNTTTTITTAASGANKTTISSNTVTVTSTVKYDAAPLVFLPKSSSSVCPFRTVNYITHTLPQQCLRTSRVALGENGTVNGNVTEARENGQEDVDKARTEDHTSVVMRDTLEESRTTSTEEGDKSTATPTPVDIEEESPLDTSKFLSFEEWKKQNLEKVGQSPENVGQGRVQNSEGRRRPINNALDTLGEEGEIELDFGGFGNGDSTGSRYTAAAADTATKAASGAPEAGQGATAASPRHRSKDAGKTCKERFNYASFDCAATILKTNARCKSSSSVLVENKDSYMLNECTAQNKFIIVELCDDILVDTVVVANFEFFSSMFRTFRVSVSDRYPVKLERWRELGTFEARNTREIQAFLVENPLIWARYLRIEFLTHYGSEFYCPVSLVRVHGTTMMEEFRKEGDEGNGIEEDVLEAEVVPRPPVSVAVEITSSTKEQEQQPEPTSTEDISGKTTENGAVQESAASDGIAEMPATNATMLPVQSLSLAGNATAEQASPSTSAVQQSTQEVVPVPPVSSTQVASQKEPPLPQSSTTEGPEPKSTKAVSDRTSDTKLSTSTSGITVSSGSGNTSTVATSSNTTSFMVGQKSTNTSIATSTIKTEKSTPSSKTTTKTSKTPAAATDFPKPAAPSIPQQQAPPPPQPPTQESFFKSTNKRLTMLETNSSLNIQYIEEQSRILRDAFIQTEKQQLRKTEKFLAHLNESVVAELKGFRMQYDQLWQSTVIELETHREMHEREMAGLGARLAILAEEVVWQKRVIVVQTVLLLLSLGLVVFVRSGGATGVGGVTNSLEFPPLMQHVVSKSQSMLRMNSRGGGATHGYETPGEEHGSPITSGREDSSPEFRRNLRRLARLTSPVLRRTDDHERPNSRGSEMVSPITPSADDDYETVNVNNPGLRFEPPTPESLASRKDRSESPMLSAEEVSSIARETSGPATPSGSRENQPLEWDAGGAGDIALPHINADSSTIISGTHVNGTGLLSSSPSSSPHARKKRMEGRGPSPLRYSEGGRGSPDDDEEVHHHAIHSAKGKEGATTAGAAIQGKYRSGSSEDGLYGDTTADVMAFDLSD